MGMKRRLSLVQRSQLPGKGYPQWDGIPTFSHFCLFASQTPSPQSLLSCASVSFPAVLRLLHPLSGSGAHHKLLTPCVCRKRAPSLGGGWEEEMGVSALCQTHTRSAPLQLPLFSLQGCCGSKEISLNPQSNCQLRQHGFRALSPAVALCPSPCAHTHFPLHTDAA